MSQLEWPDRLPAGWEAKPLRAIVDYFVSNVDKIPADNEIPVRLCNYSDVYNNEFIRLDLDFMRATATEDEIRKFRLLVDDVIITKDSESWDDIGVPSLVRETDDDLICGYHLAILRPHPDHMTGSFLFRCLQARPVRIQIELASSDGVTRFGLPKSAIGSVWVPTPSLIEQHAITAYLDLETTRLDALIAAKERLVEFLTEKRQALITHAVTRGVDPECRLRDSGVPWLGQIPAHWKIERAKWLFKERDQRSDTGEEELLTVSHLTGVTPRSAKDVNMFEAETTEGYKICHSGDLVINTLWAWMGAMGIAPMTGIVSPAYNVYEPVPQLDTGYIDALVRLPTFAQEVTRYSKGVWSSRLRLYPEGFFETILPVPPLDEQREIVNFIAAETKKLQTVKSAAERTIALLKERRSALITAAVMGQVGVGGTYDRHET